MVTDTANSLVPALRTFPQPVAGIAAPAVAQSTRQDRTKFQEIAQWPANPGRSQATYTGSGHMAYPQFSTAGRIVNVYV